MLRCGLLLAGMLMLMACGADMEREIVGTWEEVDGPEVVQFDAEGNVVLHFDGMSLEGSYEFLAGNRVLLDLRGPRVSSDPIEAPVQIDDDVLSLTMPDGRVASYARSDGSTAP